MKETAKNNEFLKCLKEIVNGKIYKQASAIYNEQGLAETVQYLEQFFNWKEVEKWAIDYDFRYYKD